MARYRGPRLKIIRRFQQHLPGLTRKTAERRPYPPGQHGTSRRGKRSEYRIRLEEKQKLRLNYGLSEKQLRSYFKRAMAFKGDTGFRLLQLVESRLDNAVFRCGYAPTIPAARQLVTHGHIQIDGKRVNIPSYHLVGGETVSVREKSRKIPLVEATTQNPVLESPSYLDIDAAKFEAMCKGEPVREDIPVDLQENLIVEFYSQIV